MQRWLTGSAPQDNEPLMKALAHLISLNRPELVLFVGEALVGNEALDQISKFNQVPLADLCVFAPPAPSWLLCLCCNRLISSGMQRLTDLADANDKRTRAIDGIVLTKFDTIDDKVMLWSRGCFVGE